MSPNPTDLVIIEPTGNTRPGPHGSRLAEFRFAGWKPNPNAKSLRLCEKCGRTPILNSECHVCLRTLLDEAIADRDAALNAAELRGQDTGLALMKAENDETLKTAIRFADLIKAAEWSAITDDPYDHIPGCPWCGGAQSVGHASDCAAFNGRGSIR